MWLVTWLMLLVLTGCVEPRPDRPRPLLDRDGYVHPLDPASTTERTWLYVPEDTDPRLSPLPEPDLPECIGTGQWVFEEVNQCAGVDPLHILPPFGEPLFTRYVTGQAWADFNGDTWLDLIVAIPSSGPRIFLGSSTGEFTESYQPGTEGLAAISASVADMDHDGDPDVFLGGEADYILENVGGQLIDTMAPVSELGLSYIGAWSDADGNGELELLVVDQQCPSCETIDPCVIHTDHWYGLTPSGWVDQSTSLFGTAGIHCGLGFSAAWGDLDNDGDSDVYVVNDKGRVIDDSPDMITFRNTFWRNDGPGCGGVCFTEISKQNETAGYMDSMGVDYGDYDNDGDLDIAVTDTGPTRVFRNDGGAYTDVTDSLRIGPNMGGDGWGLAWVDFDNDGDLDLYTASSFKNILHRNDDGVFVQIASLALSDPEEMSRGVAAADYDRDGLVDLVVGNPGSRFRVLRNTSESEHNWVGFRLVGEGAGGRDALGARVWVTDTSGRVQLREVRSGSSNGAGSDLGLHFGLGPEELVDVRVIWPDGVEHTIEVYGNRWTVVDRSLL